MKKLLTLCFLLVAFPAWGTTFYVATTGNDSNSCATAQSASTPRRTIIGGIGCVTAGAGDTVIVASGNYGSELVGSSFSTKSGTSWANAMTVKAATPLGVQVSRISPDNAANAYIIWDGFLISCGATSGTTGMYINGGAHHQRFQNGEVTNCGQGGQLGPTGGVGGNEFINMNVHHNGSSNQYHGFYVSTSNNIIRNCQIHHNSGYGIQFYPGSPNSGGQAYSNTIYDNATAGSLGEGGITDFQSGTLIYNNLIYHTTSQLQGIELRGSGGAAYGNTIYGHTNQGIQCYSGSSTPVKNNAIFNNGTPVTNAGSCTFANNLCSGTGTGCANTSGITNTTAFTNPTATPPDLHLKSGSPLIDAGATLGAPYNVDMTGYARPQGAAYDVGAYEYGTTGGITVTMAAPPASVTSPSLTLNGTTTGTVTSVTLTQNGASIGTATLGAGTWTKAVTLAAGNNSFVATATDGTQSVSTPAAVVKFTGACGP
jgi:Right handed beta helix region